MDLNDTARVRHPRHPVEYRLGTITDVTPTPHSTYIKRYRLRFPTGEECTYVAADVMPCTRRDDHAELVVAVTEACQRLRDACRIAHDYDDDLSADIVVSLSLLLSTAAARLGIALDLAATAPVPAEHRDAAVQS